MTKPKKNKGREEKYYFKTIKEITEIVDESNFDNLSESFVEWLRAVMIYKKSPKFLQKMVKIDSETFGWIDDNKMDMHISIKVKNNHDQAK